jgi:hypothetical protein
VGNIGIVAAYALVPPLTINALGWLIAWVGRGFRATDVKPVAP